MATSAVYSDEPTIGNVVLGVGKQFVGSSAQVAANSATTQAAATPLTSNINHVTSGGAGYSVILPPATPGLSITVALATAVNTVKVFPANATDIINALGAGAAITMAALTSAEFVCAVTGQWFTVPRVPS